MKKLIRSAHLELKPTHLETFFISLHTFKHAFQASPCTFLGGGFHYEANKGKLVCQGVRRAPTEQQQQPGIPAGQSERSKTLLHDIVITRLSDICTAFLKTSKLTCSVRTRTLLILWQEKSIALASHLSWVEGLHSITLYEEHA